MQLELSCSSQVKHDRIFKWIVHDRRLSSRARFNQCDRYHRCDRYLLRDALDEAAEESVSDGLCDSDDSKQELQQESSEDEEEKEADTLRSSTRMQESLRGRTTLGSQPPNAYLGINSKDSPTRMKTSPASRSADTGSCGARGSTDDRLSEQGKTRAVGENSSPALAGWDKTIQKTDERDGLDSSFLDKYMVRRLPRVEEVHDT